MEDGVDLMDKFVIVFHVNCKNEAAIIIDVF